jgi:uncharacterized protein YkwD
MKKIKTIKTEPATQIIIFTPEQITIITNYINTYREKNQAPPLIWDSTIGLFSQNWSNYLLNNNLFNHSGNKLYGENLAWFKGYKLDNISMIKKAIDSWYNEISLYDFNNPKFSQEAGHFTALVWVASKTFAIGYSHDPITDTVIVTFNSNPPGNMRNEFKKNVLPIKNI